MRCGCCCRCHCWLLEKQKLKRFVPIVVDFFVYCFPPFSARPVFVLWWPLDIRDGPAQFRVRATTPRVDISRVAVLFALTLCVFESHSSNTLARYSPLLLVLVAAVVVVVGLLLLLD